MKTRRKGRLDFPAPPVETAAEAQGSTLQRIYDLEKHTRECLQTVLARKQELKEAREIYDGAVETLMNTIRKAHEPEFEFDPGTGEITGSGEGEED